MSGIAKDSVGARGHRDWPKHAIVGCLLLVELFPLYMML